MSDLTFWIQWNSYNRRHDGCTTHAVPEGTDKSLCGVHSPDGSWRIVGEDGDRPSCLKCLSALKKRGIINDEPTNNI